MQIYVKGRNLKVSSALRAYVDEKIGHLAHYLDQILDAHVTLRMERSVAIVDVVLNLKHHLIKAEERSPDMYASIDLVRDRLEQQIRKFKTKHWAHHVRNDGKTGGRRRRARGGSAALADDSDGADKLLQIVRLKRIEIRRMDPQEAALQMELLGHDFFLFLNNTTGAVNVLYKRRGGQLGLIETVS
jgi:putative sigma-54 modulation protein